MNEDPEDVYKRLVDAMFAPPIAGSLIPAGGALKVFVRGVLKNEEKLDPEHFLRAMKLIERCL